MTGCYTHDGRIVQLNEVGVLPDNYKLLEEMGRPNGASPDDIVNLLIEWYYSVGYSPSMLFNKDYWGA